MIWRILPLVFLFIQCSSSKVTPAALEKPVQKYMKYVPGAGGGKGIMFMIEMNEPDTNLKIEKVVVNGFELEFTVRGSVITASKFYMDPDRTVEDPNPEPVDPVLYNQDSFVAEVQFLLNEKKGSVTLSDFTEEEQPLYP